MKNKKKATGLLTFGLSLALACSLGMSTIAASAGPLGGKYYPDYPTYDEALEAAGEINLEVSEEGNVLLKNDGTLPLTGKEYVSVFGVSSAVLVGGSGNTNSVANGPDVSDRGAIYDSLVGAGFTVNPMLADYYSGMGGAANIGSETTQFSAALESTFNMYNDAAVIVLSRKAGEGADADTVTASPRTISTRARTWVGGMRRCTPRTRTTPTFRASPTRARSIRRTATRSTSTTCS